MYLQKKFTRFKNDSFMFLSLPALKQFYRQVLRMGGIFSLTVYGWVRLMFHDFPFEIIEEAGLILKTLFTGCLLVALCIGGFNLVIFIAENHKQLRKKCVLLIITLYHSYKESAGVRSVNHKTTIAGNTVVIDTPEMAL